VAAVPECATCQRFAISLLELYENACFLFALLAEEFMIRTGFLSGGHTKQHGLASLSCCGMLKLYCSFVSKVLLMPAAMAEFGNKN